MILYDHPSLIENSIVKTRLIRIFKKEALLKIKLIAVIFKTIKRQKISEKLLYFEAAEIQKLNYHFVDRF